MLQNCDARKGKDRRFSRSSTAWELKGRYPQILDDADKGVEARNLFADAKAMLKQLIAENWLQARAVIGLFPANSSGDDIDVYRDEQRKQVLTTLHNLRKQGRQPRGKFKETLPLVLPLSSAQPTLGPAQWVYCPQNSIFNYRKGWSVSSSSHYILWESLVVAVGNCNHRHSPCGKGLFEGRRIASSAPDPPPQHLVQGGAP